MYKLNTRSLCGALLLSLWSLAAHTQASFNLPANAVAGNISAAEYFFDADPGFGSGTAIAFTPGTDVTISSYGIPINSLAKGSHRLYVRTRSSAGWGETNVQPFFIFNSGTILPANAGQTFITAMEYFLDADPGFGAGTMIPLAAATDVTANNYAVSLSGLHNGVHRIYVRSKSASGAWSVTNVQTFSIFDLNTVLPANSPPSAITKMEYFLDMDPGFGNGNNIPVTAGTDITASAFAVPLSGLPLGVHRIFVRTKNTAGSWSLANIQTFNIVNTSTFFPPNAAPGNIVRSEYFFDTDPGFGQGTALAITAGTDISNTYPINIMGLGNGVHRLYVRSQHASGNWSITNNKTFSILVTTPLLPANPVPGSITKLEYFFDNDPGFGNGTTVSIGPATDLSNYNFAASITGLSNGQHTLYLRVFDDWSATNTRSFTIGTPLPLAMLSFNGIKKAQLVALTWQTAHETNTGYFEIERSRDAKFFVPIGTVKCSGGAANDYSFDDEQPSEGTNYYRLKQTGLNGQAIYSVVIAIRFISASGVHIYPNPASDILMVTTGTPVEGTVTLLGMNGAAILTETLHDTQQVRLNVSGLASGIYHIRIVSEKLNSDAQVIVRH